MTTNQNDTNWPEEMESRIRAEIAAEIRAAAVAAEPFMMHFVDWTGGVDFAIKIIEKGELT